MHTVRRLLSASKAFVSILALGAPASAAYALPLGGGGAAESARAPAPSPLAEIRASDVDFTAIVALNNCSGSLVRFTTSRPTDKAIVLTNGHCYEGGFLKPGEVFTDRSSTRTFRVLESDAQGDIATLRAERLVYATMTNTDVAIYRTNATYADIEARGVTALLLSDSRPEAASQIRVVSGYWRKIYSCSIAKFVPELREGDWTFRDSIKFSEPGCDTIGGTSGSPIIDAASHEVIGINNTGNEDGQRCTVNNPCEVDASGKVTVEKGSSYGQQTYLISSCLTAENTLDLSKSGCLLPKPKRTR